MDPERTLDFVVIGAQKAGTTTLFEHLASHPSLFLPSSKEAPFFSRDDLYPRGTAWFMHEYFAAAPPGRLLGKVSPQYMCIAGTAERLARAFPEAKLVAILRDPVQRSRSHHSMAVRKGQERRSFGEAVTGQLAPAALSAARRSRSQTDTYVAWSEYGRVLSEYREHFPSEHLLVLFTADLARDPATVVRRLHEFLGVAWARPPHLGTAFHVGGGDQRQAGLSGRLRRSAPARWLWHKVPVRYQSSLAFAYERWSTDGSNDQVAAGDIDGDTAAALRGHFSDDEATLEALIGGRLPWRASPEGDKSPPSTGVA